MREQAVERLVSIDAAPVTEALIRGLLERSRAVLDGHFALHRDRHAGNALRFRGIGRDPELLASVLDAIDARLPAAVRAALQNAKILAPESAGFFLGRGLATRHGLPLVVAQTNLRRLPTRTLLSGALEPNDRVVLVNDVATTGASLDVLRELVAERGALTVGAVLFGVVGDVAFRAYCDRLQLPAHWLVTAHWRTWASAGCPKCLAHEPLVPVAELV